MYCIILQYITYLYILYLCVYVYNVYIYIYTLWNVVCLILKPDMQPAQKRRQAVAGTADEALGGSNPRHEGFSGKKTSKSCDMNPIQSYGNSEGGFIQGVPCLLPHWSIIAINQTTSVTLEEFLQRHLMQKVARFWSEQLVHCRRFHSHGGTPILDGL